MKLNFAVLLSGGKGTRMGGPTAKQYLSLGELPVALYSYITFLECPFMDKMIVVCEEEDQNIFDLHRYSFESLSPLCKNPLFLLERMKDVSFAKPGALRQDSLKNALDSLFLEDALIFVHDAARPFINENKLAELLEVTKNGVAAGLGTKAVSTIKEVFSSKIHRTVPRETLWVMNTPQAVPLSILKKGFTIAKQKNLQATDDLFFAEIAEYPCVVVEDHPYNLKITHPLDLAIAELILKKRLCIPTHS